jgi:hypothetical protein
MCHFLPSYMLVLLHSLDRMTYLAHLVGDVRRVHLMLLVLVPLARAHH